MDASPLEADSVGCPAPASSADDADADADDADADADADGGDDDADADDADGGDDEEGGVDEAADSLDEGSEDEQAVSASRAASETPTRGAKRGMVLLRWLPGPRPASARLHNARCRQPSHIGSAQAPSALVVDLCTEHHQQKDVHGVAAVVHELGRLLCVRG